MPPGPVDTGPQRTFIETARRNQIVRAAIETIADVGYARASLGRIADRAGISRGLISYHFAGKDDLIRQVVHDVVEEGMAYMQQRILSEATASGMVRAYIESNLAYMSEHRHDMVAIVEISRNGVTADGRQRFFGSADMDQAVQVLADELEMFQVGGSLRPDFDPKLMAVAIRAAIDAVPSRLLVEPDMDIDSYAREIATSFELATRINLDKPAAP